MIIIVTIIIVTIKMLFLLDNSQSTETHKKT